MRIIVFGDVHMELGRFKDIPGIDSADLLVINGDFTNFGNRDDAEKILALVRAVNNNILALPGNLDQKDVGGLLSELGISLHGEGRTLNGLGIFGVGCSNFTPFNTPCEFAEEEITVLLETGYEQVKDAKNIILVSHAPPYNTETDRLGNGVHVGSKAVRTFIEEKQPNLCLVGHIHEAAATDLIGNTPVINPGMIKDGSWIEVVLDQGELKGTLHKGL